MLSDGKSFSRVETVVRLNQFDRKDLTISPVTLCKQIVDVSGYTPHHPHELSYDPGEKLFGDYKPLVSNGVEFKPTGNTRFKKDGTLYAYFEVYEPLLAGQTSAAVQIQMRVVDIKTGEVKSDSQAISTTPYVSAGSPVIRIGRGIDISKLPKGSYRLEVRATDSMGKNTNWRTANFKVE